MCDEHGISEELKHKIMKIFQIIIKQNHFQFENTLYIQEEGLAMGTPTLSIFSAIYLQHIENTITADILLKYHIVGYFCYMDVILMVYNKDISNIYDIFNIFNTTMPPMKFTIEEEKENKIKFLEITLLREKDSLSFDVYGKPATTDTIIPNGSCHPSEQKLAAVIFLTNRMETYNLNIINKEKE